MSAAACGSRTDTGTAGTAGKTPLAENGTDPLPNGTHVPYVEPPENHPVDAVNRRRCRGEELTRTLWTDLGVNDDDAEEDGDAALCVLELLIEQHLSRTITAAEPDDTSEDAGGSSGDTNQESILAADAPWRSELQHFVATIRSRYNPVPFHSYHHATHVTLSANKLMASLEVMDPNVSAAQDLIEKRADGGLPVSAAPSSDGTASGGDDRSRSSRLSKSSVRSSLSQSISLGTVPTSLERIAFVFTALIHDVSHVGVSNAQLEMENHPVHLTYADPIHMQSYAECHSVEIGLDLLRNEDRYRSLRSALFSSTPASALSSGLGVPPERSEKSGQAFEDLVRHLVMCTDIASAERRKLGMERWQSSFGEGLSLSGGGTSRDVEDGTAASLCSDEESYGGQLPESKQEKDGVDEEMSLLRRRTMLEQLMQLSDVSHLTQSWETFLKWNERLYWELIEAYQRRINENAEDWLMDGTEGDAKADGSTRSRPKTPPPHPSEGWYEGQIGFYDFYIIPLAKRVEGCASLENGVGHMIVDNAQKNRQRWVEQGREVTERMISFRSDMDEENEQMPDRRNAFGEAGRVDSSNSLTALAYESDVSIESGCDEESLSLTGLRSVGRSRRVSKAAKAKSTHPRVNRLDAAVPRILAGQILDTIHERCRLNLEEASGSASNDVHLVSSAQKAITSYWQTGSIMRYRACILLVDISGFTNMAQMFAVDHFKSFINDYFTEIINIITSHGGEVAKFAGDALYAVWTSSIESNDDACDDWDNQHAIAVARCVACGSAVNAKCNNYRVAQTYSRHRYGAKRGRREALKKQRSKDSIQTLHKTLGELRLEGTVNLNADGSGYEEKVAFLNVHCGIAEGIVAAVNVCAPNRSEFFFIGTPMAEVAEAEGQATAGELVISSSIKRILDANEHFAGADGLERHDFVECKKGDFFKVHRATASTDAASANGRRAPNHSSSFLTEHIQPFPGAQQDIEAAIVSMQDLALAAGGGDSLSRSSLGADNGPPNSASDQSKTKKVTWRRRSSNCSSATGSTSLGDTITNFIDTPLRGNVDKGPAANDLASNIVSLMESHSHESVRTVKESMMPAELRNVVVLFIKILYEPELSTTSTDADEAILDRFQRIFGTIHNCLLPLKGQVRQFISDDKGTVCIASFGLRGSATLNLAATAVDAAMKIQKELLHITETECTIGITLGKAFCGDIGCPSRHEFSIVGSSVNLSARLMAKGARGTISCDEALVENDTEHQYSCDFKHRLKGYDEPVPFYNPKPVENDEEVTPLDTHIALHTSVRCDEIRGLIEHIHLQQDLMEREEVRANGENEPKESGAQPRAVMVSARAGAGKAQFIDALLDHHEIKSRATILIANKCYHNTPFYCWVPIISRIVKTSKDVVKRIQALKRLRRKLLLPPSLVSNAAADSSYTPDIIDNDALVAEDLLPYLSLLNDFLFLGVPLFRSTDKVKTLKDAQKVDKAIEILTSMIQRYIARNRRPAIIAISDIDTIDDCSRKLVQNLYGSRTNLVFLCTTHRGTRKRRLSMGSVESAMSADVLDSVFGDSDSERTEFIRLEPLGKDAVFEIFKSSIRGISEEDETTIDWRKVAERVHDLCGGVVRHAIELAHAVSIELRRMSKVQSAASDRTSSIVNFLEDFPVSKMEELIALRFDALSQEQQLLLKVASVAGLNQHSFSLSLLETLMLDVSAGDMSETSRNDNIGGGVAAVDLGGGDIPLSVGSTGGSEDMFQGDNFEIMVHSLVEAGFLILIDDENADYLSMESTQSFRFASALEQMCVNELMIEDQKRELHHLLAEHYENRLLGLGDERDVGFLEDDVTDGGGSISTLTTSFTMGTSVGAMRPSWQITHLTATHFSMAAASIQALLYFFDAATELARLGLREKSHGSLLSAYSCFEQRLDQCRRNEDNIVIQNGAQERNRLATRLLQMICEVDVPPAMDSLTQDHLRWMFESSSQDFVVCIKMLFKFGQSIGIIEKEGYVHGAKVYQQVVFLTLLGLSEEAFARTVSQLQDYLDDSIEASITDDASDNDDDDPFSIDDLAVSFPAFSGLLTFYRDSPIQNETNLSREKVLATLFVAVTEQQDDMVHILRTKCILSHLFMKTGDFEKALSVSEVIKSAYNHDEHSLQMVQMYGMDWALINITTIVSVYIFRADITKALNSISFLEIQLEKVDEFASSTKAMLKGVISAAYLLLRRFDKAVAISTGISSTSYGFFYKPSSILQEGLNRKLERLHRSAKSIDSTSGQPSGTGSTSTRSTVLLTSSNESLDIEDEPENDKANDLNVLEILGTEKCHSVCFKRSMLHPSIEVLSDRGMEAINAAICMAQIELLEKDQRDTEVMDLDLIATEMKYCKAGLVHLEQSLGQKDAGSHEKLTNYLSCLYQKAELLVWRNRLGQKLEAKDGVVKEGTQSDPTVIDDTEGGSPSDANSPPQLSEIEEAISILQECEKLCLESGYYLMLLMVGARYIHLNLDVDHGKAVVSRAFEEIGKSKPKDDLLYAHSIYESLCDSLIISP